MAAMAGLGAGGLCSPKQHQSLETGVNGDPKAVLGNGPGLRGSILDRSVREPPSLVSPSVKGAASTSLPLDFTGTGRLGECGDHRRAGPAPGSRSCEPETPGHSTPAQGRAGPPSSGPPGLPPLIFPAPAHSPSSPPALPGASQPARTSPRHARPPPDLRDTAAAMSERLHRHHEPMTPTLFAAFRGLLSRSGLPGRFGAVPSGKTRPGQVVGG